ncbi:tetratricopeptide repeat protein [Pseudomonas sp. CAU 1711]|uniref:tetratricopeptide repeat protein n=1 Tax=Pseudomonas sp. CAU 1711 TaxID=3140356 RepID=UPI0032610D2D
MNRNLTLLALALVLVGCQSTPAGPDRSIFSGRNSVLYQVQEQASSPQQAMRMAAIAYQGGALDQALYQYLRAIELDPNEYEAMVWVGRIHRERGNNHLAELAYADVLQNQPDNLSALTEMGLLQLAMQRPASARELLGKALAVDQRRQGGADEGGAPRVDGESPLRLYNGLGVLADLANDFDKAASFYRLAQQIEPRSPVVANSQAYSLYLAGKWSEAEAQYRRGLSFDGRYEPLWRNYGLLLARMGRYEEALSSFEQVESRAAASNDVGYVCLIQGRLDAAEQFFQSAIDQSPAHFAMAWENLQRVKQIRRLRQHGGARDGAEEAESFAVMPKEALKVTP